MIEVSIIIPHYNDLENLALCLDKLAAQTFPRERVEIVIADNNSSVGIDAVRAVAGDAATVILAAEQGAGPARNAAVAASRGEILAFTDSDCRPEPRWLEEGVAALANADVVGGLVQVAPAEEGKPRPVEAFEMVFAFNNEFYVSAHGYSVTANMFVRRAAFDAIGEFRNGVSEDVEWGNRAIARGYSLGYSSKVVVEHPARMEWPDLEKKWRKATREAYLLARERRLGRLHWFARSWAVLLSPLPHLPQVLSSKTLPSRSAKAAAAAVLFRVRFYRFLEANRLLMRGR